MNNYALDKKNLLGQGAFGNVYRAHQKKTNQEVAIKIFHVQHTLMGLHESTIIKALPLNPHLPRWVDQFFVDEQVYLVSSLCQGKELWELRCDQTSPFPTHFLMALATQMIEALDALYKASIVHRDIKLENILVDETKLHFTLIDFDAAVMGHHSILKPGGTFGYLSPPLVDAYMYFNTHGIMPTISREVYHHSDVFALGVILFTLMENEEPYTLNSFFDVFDYHDFKFPTPMKHPDDFLKSMVKKMLENTSSASDIKTLMKNKM
jgi:serine/threonine protein kinase